MHVILTEEKATGQGMWAGAVATAICYKLQQGYVAMSSLQSRVVPLNVSD